MKLILEKQINEKFKFLILYSKMYNEYVYYTKSEEGFGRVMSNKEKHKKILNDTPMYIRYAGDKSYRTYLTYADIKKIINNDVIGVTLFGTNELDLRDEMIILNNCKGELNETEYKFE